VEPHGVHLPSRLEVIFVPMAETGQQIAAAQRRPSAWATISPTAIVYRTVKGWQYGIEGKGSHGAGHKLCRTASSSVETPSRHDEGQASKMRSCQPALAGSGRNQCLESVIGNH